MPYAIWFILYRVRLSGAVGQCATYLFQSLRPLHLVCIICIGVVNVYMQYMVYNCVYYCDMPICYMLYVTNT
jgi:hypothetical protein